MTRGAGAGSRGAWKPARVPLAALRRKVGDRRDSEGPKGKKQLLQGATAG